MVLNRPETRHGCGVVCVTSAPGRRGAHIPNIIGKFVLAITGWRNVKEYQPCCVTPSGFWLQKKKSCYNNCCKCITEIAVKSSSWVFYETGQQGWVRIKLEY